jgi:hypothetical protein
MDTLYWTDCSQKGPEYIKYYKTPKAEKVLGIECDKITFVYPNRESSYYYNSDTLRTNPKWGAKMTYYHGDILSREMRALPVMIKLEYKDFVVYSTATEIKYKPIPDYMFDIPRIPMAKEK